MKERRGKLLIIVDMQNDFITGSLANKDAEAIVPGICDLIKNWKGDIFCTQDTHYPNYLETQEGNNLPVEHCIYQTAGWCIHDDILKTLRTKNYNCILKSSFGSPELTEYRTIDNYEEVVLVGTCTDICVVSNALLVKSFFPEVKVTVISSLCAGVTKEKHEAALETMRSCQINVVSEVTIPDVK